MTASLLTHKFALVPTQFFDPSRAREYLSETLRLQEDDNVLSVEVPQYGATLVYCAGSEDGISGNQPEIFHILSALPECPDYNKIVCTFEEGYLYLAIAQGGSLLLANAFRAVDFTTAEYFIFRAMNSFQLNPEISTICWRHPIAPEEEISLCSYFKAVRIICG